MWSCYGSEFFIKSSHQTFEDLGVKIPFPNYILYKNTIVSFLNWIGRSADGWTIGSEPGQETFSITTRNRTNCPNEVTHGFDRVYSTNLTNLVYFRKSIYYNFMTNLVSNLDWYKCLHNIEINEYLLWLIIVYTDFIALSSSDFYFCLPKNCCHFDNDLTYYD